MKKFLIIVSLIFIMAFSTSILVACKFNKVKAEEIKQEIIQVEKQLNDETEKTEIEKLKEKVAELTAKLTELTSGATNYFKSYILPVLTGGTTGSILSLIIVLANSKSKNKTNSKYDKLLEAYSNLSKENKEYAELLKNTDITEIGNTLKKVFDVSLIESINKLKIDSQSIAEINARLDILTANVNAIINALKSTDALGNSDECMKQLNSNATQQALEQANKEILELKEESINNNEINGNKAI